ncbi:MAG TPA: PP0621 family protein [Burkholderiales bacterium]|nr:PP0621 family protein [Burkholderiales bacterium]
MGRFLFFVLLALIVYLAIRVLRRRPPPQAPRKVAEKMVHCDHCGLYLPESEAIHAQGRHYCSVEHQRGVQK